MRKKLKLRPIHLTVPKVKKIDIPRDTSDNDISLEELEEKVRLAQAKVAPAVPSHTKLPPKPKRSLKKPHRRELSKLGPYIPVKQWAGLVRNVFPKDCPYTFAVAEDADRFDVVCDDGWRIVCMASYGGEFQVELYYNYACGFNTKKISVDYITKDLIQTAVQFLVDSKELFMKTKGK